MKKNAKMVRLPHGYFNGEIVENVCPTITISSFEFNNFVMEIEDIEVLYKGHILHDGDGLYIGTTDAFFRGGAKRNK